MSLQNKFGFQSFHGLTDVAEVILKSLSVSAVYVLKSQKYPRRHVE